MVTESAIFVSHPGHFPNLFTTFDLFLSRLDLKSNTALDPVILHKVLQLLRQN